MTSPSSGASPRASIWRAPGFLALVWVTFFGFSGYAVLLPLAPSWAVAGGAGPAGSGLVNGVMLGSTVLFQLMVPAALRRWGWGPVMAVGVFLLGLPSLLHLLSDSLPWILLLAAVRGMGFAVLTVTGSAAAAHLVDPARRGAAIGAYGLAVALPNLLFMPWGPTIAERLGWLPVFLIGALPMLGVPATLALAPHLPHGGEEDEEPGRGWSGEAAQPATSLSRTYRALVPPALLLLAVTLAGGSVITFAPQLVERPGVATAGLLATGLTSAVARWLVGGLADRFGAGTFVWPLTLLGAASMAALALVLGLDDWSPVGEGSVLAWVGLLALFGVAYGALQNLTLVLSYALVRKDRISTASAVWNIGFDLGTAVGAVAVGAIASGAGFGWGLLVAGLACAATLPLAWRERGVVSSR
ncbi:MFS transporter [Ornithinimicrobium panacihumi]|uniref:MFS transporter n=1 Tax=Ornithinimicrobium panacihumi TaxID=2008449 RepID=UPI003F88D757